MPGMPNWMTAVSPPLSSPTQSFSPVHNPWPSTPAPTSPALCNVSVPAKYWQRLCPIGNSKRSKSSPPTWPANSASARSPSGKKEMRPPPPGAAQLWSCRSRQMPPQPGLQSTRFISPSPPLSGSTRSPAFSLPIELTGPQSSRPQALTPSSPTKTSPHSWSISPSKLPPAIPAANRLECVMA